MQQIINAFYEINWLTPSWDLFIYLFFIVGTLLYGFTLGRDRVVSILIIIYISLAVINSTPYVDRIINGLNIDLGQFFAFKTVGFIVVFIVLFFLLSRSVLLSNVSGSIRSGSLWQIILFSILQVGLLISIILSFLPEDIIGQLAPLTQYIFVSDPARFIWIIAPIVGILFVKSE